MATVRLTPQSVFARDFRVVRPLAEGGMGAVYVVEQLGHERVAGTHPARIPLGRIPLGDPARIPRLRTATTASGLFPRCQPGMVDTSKPSPPRRGPSRRRGGSR